MRLSRPIFAKHFMLLILGGGSAGIGASFKFAKKLPKNSIALIEPHTQHYYQPGFTLVGGGLMTLEANVKPQASLIHPNTVWIQRHVTRIDPASNSVTLSDGENVTYDFMLVATGVTVRFDKIAGLPDAFETPGVSSIYSPLYVQKTYKDIQNFKSGTALFTFPNAPIKCAGAPQKICYIADSLFRKSGKRDKAHLVYATALGRLFGVEKYRLELEKVAARKGVDIRLHHNLISVDAKNRLAKFELLDEDNKPNGKTTEIEYNFLHVGPPCLPIEPLLNCQPLADKDGFVDVDPKTLQSKAFGNVFAVGDCINATSGRTAAAVSSQLKAVEKNLMAVIEGKPMPAEYDGYASCPLVVSTNRVILAEFNPQGPLETTPLDQSKPRFTSFLMKRYLMPFIYWHGLTKGIWNGPSTIRRILHLGFPPKQD